MEIKKGRKIEMKRIADGQKRSVTLCKRRQGLFSKARSLHQDTGADIAVIVFSQSGKPSVYASTSLQTTLDRFLSGTPPADQWPFLQESPSHGPTPAPIDVAVQSWIDQASDEAGLERLRALREEGEEMRERLLKSKREDEDMDDFIHSLLTDHLL